MKKFKIKKLLSFVIALSLLMSCAVCGTVGAAAADGKVTYKYVVTSGNAAAYEGTLTYPADALEVDRSNVTVYNATGTFSVSDGKIIFNFTSSDDIDFSEGLAVITVVFTVKGDYNKSDVDTVLYDFYSTDQAKGKENIPYKYAHVFDDEVFESGYVDIDNPENNNTDPTVSQELIDAKNELSRIYEEAINTIFSDDYTEESIQRVFDALSDAEEILFGSGEVTVEEVKAQIEALQNALDSLEKNETVTESSSSEPSSESEETTEPTEPLESESSEPDESSEPVVTEPSESESSEPDESSESVVTEPSESESSEPDESSEPVVTE
ncbi:MAG: hypothetical protein J1E96_07890, partial [Ruminococcus sp.]|nr:hypothetical protein [Ruminococcus sp.]